MQDNLYEEKMDIMYLRLSLEDKDVQRGEKEESFSIGSQRSCIQSYANKKSSMPKNLIEFVDDGHSGTSMDRPAMKRILQLVSMNRVRTIVVRDLSRFARNYLEAGHYLEYVFPSYGVRFVSINDNYDSADYANSSKKLFEIAIRNLINEWYSRDISKKIKSAVDLKKMRGEYVYGTAPFGYKKGEKKNTIVVDPIAAEIVVRIFKSACDGMTVTQIAKMLNAEGVTTPSVYLKDVRGKYKTYPTWSFESVKNILDNRIYTGDTVPFKSHVIRVGSNRVKHIPEEEQIVIPDTHEPIISREMYYQAKLVVKSNKKSRSSENRNVLSGYLTCGCCGHKLQKGRPTNKNWLCASARYVEDSECHHIRLNEAMMKEKLLSAIQLQCKVADAAIEVARKEQSKEKDVLDGYKWELRKYERESDEYKNELMTLMDAYYDGELSKEDFVAKKQRLNDADAELKAKIEDITSKIAVVKAKISAQVDEECEAGKIVKHQNIDELNHDIMNELISRIVVFPNNAVQILWNFHET